MAPPGIKEGTIIDDVGAEKPDNCLITHESTNSRGRSKDHEVKGPSKKKGL